VTGDKESMTQVRLIASTYFEVGAIYFCGEFTTYGD